MHVTLRCRAKTPFLREQVVYRRIRDCFVRAVKRGLRVLHWSVQGNHVHMIVEAQDRVRLWRAAQGLASGIARAVNRASGRRGSLWRDRYHRHDLTTARQVRTALVYVLQNFRKHHRADRTVRIRLDHLSSAAWFDGWSPRAGPLVEDLHDWAVVSELGPDRPIAEPRSELARSGWRRLGLIEPREAPLLAIAIAGQFESADSTRRAGGRSAQR